MARSKRLRGYVPVCLVSWEDIGDDIENTPDFHGAGLLQIVKAALSAADTAIVCLRLLRIT